MLLARTRFLPTRAGFLPTRSHILRAVLAFELQHDSDHVIGAVQLTAPALTAALAAYAVESTVESVVVQLHLVFVLQPPELQHIVKPHAISADVIAADFIASDVIAADAIAADVFAPNAFASDAAAADAFAADAFAADVTAVGVTYARSTTTRSTAARTTTARAAVAESPVVQWLVWSRSASIRLSTPTTTCSLGFCHSTARTATRQSYLSGAS